VTSFRGRGKVANLRGEAADDFLAQSEKNVIVWGENPHLGLGIRRAGTQSAESWPGG